MVCPKADQTQIQTAAAFVNVGRVRKVKGVPPSGPWRPRAQTKASEMIEFSTSTFSPRWSHSFPFTTGRAAWIMVVFTLSELCGRKRVEAGGSEGPSPFFFSPRSNLLPGLPTSNDATTPHTYPVSPAKKRSGATAAETLRRNKGRPFAARLLSAESAPRSESVFASGNVVARVSRGPPSAKGSRR
jgi:hypothetical protein